MDDPEYQLERQAREAMQRIAKTHAEIKDGMNIRNILNVICDDSGAPSAYEVSLSEFSREVLRLQGVTDDRMNVSAVTSVSKALKQVLEVNLGFEVREGKGHSRIVRIPAKWVVEDGDGEEERSG